MLYDIYRKPQIDRSTIFISEGHAIKYLAGNGKKQKCGYVGI